jgi:hypothetical protein
MELAWTPWAQERLLPVPGNDAFEIDLSDTLTLGEMPFDELLEFGIAQRVPERNNEKGNPATDSHGDRLVDTCVATGGVELATRFLVEVCGRVSEGIYGIRRDGAPWGRLRQHLAAASPEERKKAKAIAAKARDFTDQRRQAVAFAFCDPAWVAEDFPEVFRHKYGKLALIASLSTAEQAREAMWRLLGKDDTFPPPHYLVEEAVAFIPNLMRVMDAADADLIIEGAKLAWNKSTLKPWLEIVACLPGKKAQAFLAKHGYKPPVAKGSNKPAANKPGAKKPGAKKPGANKPGAKKPAAKSPAKKPAAKKPAAKERSSKR